MTKNYIAHGIQAAALLLAATALGSQAYAATPFIAKCNSGSTSGTSLNCSITVPAGVTYDIRLICVYVESLANNSPAKIPIALTTSGQSWTFYEPAPLYPDLNGGVNYASGTFPGLALEADAGTTVAFSVLQPDVATADMTGMFVVISGTSKT